MFVLVGYNDDSLVVGKNHKGCSIHKNSEVYFIPEVYQAVCQSEMSAYHSTPLQETYYCVLL